MMEKCQLCGHAECLTNTPCPYSIKANKKIRQAPRKTEPIKWLACGCTGKIKED